MNHRRILAARLQAALEQQELTYEEAARRVREHLPSTARLSNVSLWQYANGKAYPRRRSLLTAIGQALSIPVSYLMASGPAEGEDESPAQSSGDSQIRVEDLGDGRASLAINLVVAWPTAVRILAYLTGGTRVDDEQHASS